MKYPIITLDSVIEQHLYTMVSIKIENITAKIDHLSEKTDLILIKIRYLSDVQK